MNTEMKKLDRRTICQLIKASIEEESNAGKEYSEILKLMPDDEEYRECSEVIIEIMQDEARHAINLIEMEKRLNCKEGDD